MVALKGSKYAPGSCLLSFTSESLVHVEVLTHCGGALCTLVKISSVKGHCRAIIFFHSAMSGPGHLISKTSLVVLMSVADNSSR